MYCRPVERVCENCASEDDDLVVVHRLYVVPEAGGRPRSVTRLDQAELWCFSCRSLYPHEVQDGDED